MPRRPEKIILRAYRSIAVSSDAGKAGSCAAPPPFPITRGQALAVLPFGNVVVTLPVSGVELKAICPVVLP